MAKAKKSEQTYGLESVFYQNTRPVDTWQMVTGHLIFYYFPFLKECFKNVSSFHLTFSDQCSSVEIGIKCAKTSTL
jgi:hypothetical protein